MVSFGSLHQEKNRKLRFTLLFFTRNNREVWSVFFQQFPTCCTHPSSCLGELWKHNSTRLYCIIGVCENRDMCQYNVNTTYIIRHCLTAGNEENVSFKTNKYLIISQHGRVNDGLHQCTVPTLVGHKTPQSSVCAPSVTSAHPRSPPRVSPPQTESVAYIFFRHRGRGFDREIPFWLSVRADTSLLRDLTTVWSQSEQTVGGREWSWHQMTHGENHGEKAGNVLIFIYTVSI